MWSFLEKIFEKKELVRKKRIARRTRKKRFSAFEKFEGNPILSPNERNAWESVATFNPAALCIKGKVHLLYRAIGNSGISVLGYVSSKDGFNVSEKSEYPVYFNANANQKPLKTSSLKEPPISYASGGSWNGGCEDPRLTLINGRIYLIYTVFDGWSSLRMALSSISLKDFLKQKWNWKKPVLISPPGEIHKNWVLFPEKINGKYAILHSITPDVSVDYFNSLDYFKGNYIKSQAGNRVPPRGCRGIWLRGVGPPPIKTKYGWLLLCHAMDTRDLNKYKLGAMILDSNDPTKILYRSQETILSPEEYYENDGLKYGIIYSCGMVVKDGKLFVYYGGSDQFSCVATANLDKFIEELVKTGKPKIRKIKKIRKKMRIL